MTLSMIQTEIVACALCEADGKNPDEDVPTGELEVVRVGPGAVMERAVTVKAWQTYETEARKYIVASQALEKWSSTLRMFHTIASDVEAVRPA